jgi:16S rRNA (uracil1498-N3)-methyltransferase
LNVTAVQWLDCERGVVKPREDGGKMEKWRRLAIESAKQCGRTHVLMVLDTMKMSTLGKSQTNRVLWLDPGPGGVSVIEALGDWQGGVLALIGPEGGWSDRERNILEDAVKGGWVRRVRLTTSVLRIETACAAVAAIIMSR